MSKPLKYTLIIVGFILYLLALSFISCPGFDLCPSVGR